MQQNAIKRVKNMQARAKMMTESSGDIRSNCNVNSHPRSSQSKLKNQSVRMCPRNHLKNNRNSETKLSHENSNNRIHTKSEEKGQEEIHPPISQVDGFKNILKVFLKDQEKTLIIVLIMLLVSENEDPGIILALMYVIM